MQSLNRFDKEEKESSEAVLIFLEFIPTFPEECNTSFALEEIKPLF